MTISRQLSAAALALFTAAAVVRADPTPDQLKAVYDETVRQLQQSQDRKNQLANENEQLKARVNELQTKLNAIEAQSRQADFLRAQAASWATFMQRYPQVLKRFEAYIGTGNTSQPQASAAAFFDPDWPFTALVVLDSPATEPTTQPVTAPATEPAALSTTRPATSPASSQPTTQPTTDPTTAPATGPTTATALVQMFHGRPNHWCALCAAAAGRKAEAGRVTKDAIGASVAASSDLMQDLPPR